MSFNTIPLGKDTLPQINNADTTQSIRWILPELDIIPSAPTKTPGAVYDADAIARLLEDEGLPCKCTLATHAPMASQYHLRFLKRSDALKKKRIVEFIEMETCLNARIVPSTHAHIAIEMNRLARETVHFQEVLTMDDKFVQHRNGYGKFIIGIDTNNQPLISDLHEAKHILIAGSTGCGKSTMLNSLLTSLAISSTPSELRLILADFKRVELAAYEGMPHLLTPILHDIYTLHQALKHAVYVMTIRYQENKKNGRKESGADHPWVVIVIDEMASAILQGGDGILQPLMRISAEGRAAKIALVLSTQRPQRDVIPLLIRDNLPTRIGMTCKSQYQSKVVIDESGLEKLSYFGDSLIDLPGETQLRRVQTPLISDDTIAAVVNYWKDGGKQ